VTHVIRAATAADRDAIEACLRSDATFTADELAIAMSLVDGGLAGDPDYALRVAEGGGGGGIAGYACFGPTPVTRATWDLYWIVVDARARGRGVGRGLLAAVEDAIRGGDGRHVRIETGAGPAYAAARALYARAGYPEVARFDDFYAPGDAMIVYYKGL
jgi:ribosomal protein S18 acetylase RimI-like enzyme